LACPFFAPDSMHVSLVLFVDSEETNFFSSDVLGTISAASRGFVEILEELHRIGAFRPVPSYYPGYPITIDAANSDLIKRLKMLGVQFEDENFQEIKKSLTFKTLKSLDFEAGYSSRFAF
jgi:hypothetical protein